MAGKRFGTHWSGRFVGHALRKPERTSSAGNTGITGGGIFAQSMPGGMPTGMAPAAMQPVIVLQGGGGVGSPPCPGRPSKAAF